MASRRLPGESSTPLRSWQAHRQGLGGLAFSPDSLLLYSYAGAEPLKRWRADADWKELPTHDPPLAQTFAFSGDRRWLYTASGRQKLLDARTLSPHFNEPALPAGDASFSSKK